MRTMTKKKKTAAKTASDILEEKGLNEHRDDPVKNLERAQAKIRVTRDLNAADATDREQSATFTVEFYAETGAKPHCRP